jgi:hypothetical protein
MATKRIILFYLFLAFLADLNASALLTLMVQLPQSLPSQSTAGVNAYENVARQIKQDKSHRYRVMDLSAGNPFINGDAAKEFNIIGGYSAAKLRRYDDLINYHISNGNPAVYNMLNTKYLIEKGADGQLKPSLNNGALGAVWLVRRIKWVDTPEEELGALYSFNPKEEAVVHKSFSENLTGLNPTGEGKIVLSSYSGVELNYEALTQKEELAVFSEIWYGPDTGWDVFVNDKKVAPIRVNYALRGLRIPAGYSEIQFIFRPKSVYIGRQIAVIFSSISLVMLGFVMFKGLKNALNEQPAEIKKEKMATPVLPKKKK